MCGVKAFIVLFVVAKDTHLRRTFTLCLAAWYPENIIMIINNKNNNKNSSSSNIGSHVPGMWLLSVPGAIQLDTYCTVISYFDVYPLQVVWLTMQNEFIKQYNHFTELIQRCYPDAMITIEFSLEDLLGYFSNIAQQHWASKVCEAEIRCISHVVSSLNEFERAPSAFPCLFCISIFSTSFFSYRTCTTYCVVLIILVTALRFIFDVSLYFLSAPARICHFWWWPVHMRCSGLCLPFSCIISTVQSSAFLASLTTHTHHLKHHL